MRKWVSPETVSRDPPTATQALTANGTPSTRPVGSEWAGNYPLLADVERRRKKRRLPDAASGIRRVHADYAESESESELAKPAKFSAKPAKKIGLVEQLNAVPKAMGTVRSNHKQYPIDRVMQPTQLGAKGLAMYGKDMNGQQHSLTVNSEGELFCDACCTLLQTKRTTLTKHLLGRGHATALAKYEAKKLEDQVDTALITQFFKANPSAPGHTKDAVTSLHRFKCLEAMLFAGVKPGQIDKLRTFLKRGKVSLTSGDKLVDEFLHLVLEKERANFKWELESQHSSSTVDGTTRLGEALCMTSRFCTEQFELRELLTMFLTTEKSVDGEQLASLWGNHVSTTLAIPVNRHMSFIADSVGTNHKAIAIMTGSVTLNQSLSIRCVSHTLNNGGKHFVLAIIDKFTSAWLIVMNVKGAMKLWRRTVGEKVFGYSSVRWWSKAEIWMLCATHRDKLPGFLRECIRLSYGEESTAVLKEMILDDPRSWQRLRYELCATLQLRPQRGRRLVHLDRIRRSRGTQG